MEQQDLERAVAEVAAMAGEHHGVWALLQRFGFDPMAAREDVQAIVGGVLPDLNESAAEGVADAFVVGFLVGAQVREERDGVSA